MSETVTFIMPAYNAAAYIGEAIDSVLAQTVSDWRLIIIDDASGDNTLQIAEKYASGDERISVIHRETPSGSPFIPRKTGIESAPTSLVSPLDADDRIAPDYLQNLLAVMKDAGADAVYPMMYEWRGIVCRPLVDPGNPESVSLKEGEELQAAKEALYKPGPGKEMVRLTLDGWKVNCNGGIISKELYLNAFGEFSYDTSNANADEVLTRLILLLANRVVFTREKYYYRSNTESITRKYSPKRFDSLKAQLDTIDLIRRYYSENSNEYLLAHRHLLHICAYYLQLINDVFPHTARQFGIQCVEEARRQIDFNLIKPHSRHRLWKLMQLPANRAIVIISVRDNAKRLLTKGKSAVKSTLRLTVGPLRRRLKNIIASRNELKLYAAEINALKDGQILKGSDSYVYQQNYYTSGEECTSEHSGRIICPFDGTLRHGGLTDRIRGILSTYAEAKRSGREFYISWTSPFRLEDYLVPADVDWRIERKEILRDTSQARPVVIQDISPEVSKRLTRAAISGFKCDLHIYSNSDAEAGHYKELYHELFKPSPMLQKVVLKHKQQLGNRYWAFTFRFLELLGDFKDSIGHPLQPPAAECLMKKALDEMLQLMNNLPDGYRVHLTSDSGKFLKYASEADPRIHIIKGNVINIDLQQGPYDEAWLKTFADQQLLMGAERVYRMCTGDMYPTGFPKFAAEVGGTKFIDYKF